MCTEKQPITQMAGQSQTLLVTTIVRLWIPKLFFCHLPYFQGIVFMGVTSTDHLGQQVDGFTEDYDGMVGEIIGFVMMELLLKMFFRGYVILALTGQNVTR